MNTNDTINAISTFARRPDRLIPAVLAACLITSGAMGASWSVSGYVKVDHKLNDLEDRYGDTSPLAGVEVEVFGRSKVLGVWAPVWDSWGTDYTDDSGQFTVGETTGSGSRQIKVKVRFKNSDLIIRDAELIDTARWYKVYEAEFSSSGTVLTGNLTFKSGGSGDLGDEEAREQADYWVLGSLLMDTMDDYGYPFLEQLIIEHGWHNPGGSDDSYCDPWTKHVHINWKAFNTDTVVHEVMHRWFYDHFDDEGALTWQVAEHLQNGQTHGLQDEGESWVSFIEGFSEFCDEKLGEILFGEDPDVPMNRDRLNTDVNWDGHEKLYSIDRMERHCGGWVSLFRLVTTPDISIYDFNTDASDWVVQEVGDATDASRYDPQLGFEAVLHAITGTSSTGKISKNDLNFEDFLHKMVYENYDYPTVTYDTDDAWLELLNPSETVQPWELFDLPTYTATGTATATGSTP